MGFLEKYRIEAMLGEGETMTFRAVDVSTEESVILHQLLPPQPGSTKPALSSILFRYLPGKGPGTEHFRAIGQEGGRIFVVAADVPECLDLRQWIDLIAEYAGKDRPLLVPRGPEVVYVSPKPRPQVAKPPAPVRPAPPLPAPPVLNVADEDEFAKAFSIANQPAAPPHTPPPPVPPKPAVSPALVAGEAPAPATPKKSLFEFDDLDKTEPMMRPAPPAPQQPPAAIAPPPPAPPAVVAPPKPPAPIAAPAPPAPPAPPKPSAPPAATTPPRPPIAAPPSERTGPGEFTQMFYGVKPKTVPPIAGKPAAPSRPATVPPAPSRPATVPPAPPAPPSGPSGPGEFTQMFSAIGKEKTGRHAAPPPQAPGSPLGHSTPEKPAPGDFTSMFSSTKPKTVPPVPPPVAPSKPAAAAPSQNAPSEFTRMFSTGRTGQHKAVPLPETDPGLGPTVVTKAPAEADKAVIDALFSGAPRSSTPPKGLPTEPTHRAPAMPAPPPESSGPGEFTQLFSKAPASPASTGSPLPGGPSRPASPFPGAPGQKEPGEFTQMMQIYDQKKPSPAAQSFELAAPAAPKPAAPPPKAGPGEYTMMFLHPPQQPGAPPAAAAPPPSFTPSAPPPPPAQGPGEYTSMFEIKRPPAAPPMAGAPPAAPPYAMQPPAGFAPPAVPPAPPMPAMPTYAPPPMPKPPAYPPAPQFQAPHPPGFQMPPMAAPQVKPPGISTNTKIIIACVLGGLFVIAVALVLYFALKH